VNKFEELKKEIRDSTKTPQGMGEAFVKYGVTPDNPDVLKGIIKDAGVQENITKESASQLVNKMTENLPPEMKKYLADFLIQFSEGISAGPMPDEIKQLLSTWQKGEKKDIPT
jgi:hypothetical protein